MDTIKAKSSMLSNNPEPEEESGKITAELQSNKLKALLGQIKQS
jgi:hypothetical protein